jgi:hypothetical protein
MPPMSALARRLVAVLVILLLLGGVAIVTLRAMGVPVALGPLASASVGPLPTATPSGGVASVGPSGSPDPAAAFAAIEGEVRQVRLLPAPDIGPAELIGRDQLQAELRAVFDAQYPQARRDADNLALRALGLLDAGQDVAALQLQLLGDQVIGFYDDTRRRMVVVSDSGVDAQARITYAHEYTHALQDAAFGLDSLQTDAIGQDDRNLARTSLIEGDAALTMVLWAIQHMTPAELGTIATTPVPDMTGIPDWMVAQLTLPYTSGADFVGTLYASGGFDAVDAAFADPPATTEQVLHPDKYTSGEVAVDVPEVDLAAALGPGWTNVPSTTMGEAMIGIWLESLGAEHADATDAGAGWGGDRLSVAGTPAGEYGMAWRIVFDAPAQSEDFERTYGALVDGLPFGARLVRTGDAELLVVHASSDALVARVVTAAGG